MKRLRILVLSMILIFAGNCPYINTAHSEEHVMQEDVGAIFSRFQEEILSSPSPLLGFKETYYDKVQKGFELDFFDKNYPPSKGCFLYNDNVINGSASRSFFVYFSSNYYYEYLLDFVTALIKAIDPNMSAADAQSSANELVSSFSGEYNKVLPRHVGFSKIVPVGDYLLIIQCPRLYMSYLYVNHKNDINIPVNKSEYNELSFQDIKSNKHTLQKIYLTGIVEEHMPATIEMYSKACVLLISSGNKYKVFYYPFYLPTLFEIGKEYTIYGVVDEKQEGDYASVDVQYMEALNDSH